ncbi:hypothetical protein A6456_36090 [Paraburkholderia tropica]|nr:hypothetical protein A6456_36090 [Paraburkholderia tropica]
MLKNAVKFIEQFTNSRSSLPVISDQNCCPCKWKRPHLYQCTKDGGAAFREEPLAIDPYDSADDFGRSGKELRHDLEQSDM